ncbi:MAG TPA: ATP-binding protein [Chloroflexota bacterium]|nr:ATP-binding protein [Chloroflexota bacterium]
MPGITINSVPLPPDGRADAIRENLDDLRGQLTTRIAVLTLVTAQLMLLFYNPPVSFPLDMLLYWAALTGLCLLVLALNTRRSVWARRLLAWGLAVALAVMMAIFPVAWLPFLGAILIFVAGLLVSGGEVVTAVMVGSTAVFLTNQGSRAYDLIGVLTVLALALAAAWLTARQLTITLDWVWHMNQRAAELLDTTRSQQADLRLVNKSLKIVNDLRERTEHELLLAHKQLREAQRLKEQFAANISHELRTPLAIILGFSEVMVLSPEVYGDQSWPGGDNWPPKLMRDIYQIYRNSRHLLGLIDDILDLSRFEMVGFTLHKEPTVLAPLLYETAAIVNNLFESSPDISLRLEIPPNLPAVEVDQTRIRQVVLNLLNNARRYTEVGAVTLRAETAVNEVIIQVQDTGPGIAPEQLAHIFTEFYQVDHSLSRQHGGVGLGLAICQRFVEAHDGRIWAESAVGIGSTFAFSLPLPHVRPAPKPYQTRPIEPLPQAVRPCLLAADPDPLVISLLQRHLAEFEIVPISSPDEMAEQIATYHPLAAIYNLPPGQIVPPEWVNGLTIPIIECSLPSQAWMADTLGAVACLTKPINFEQLRAEIESLGAVQQVLVVDDNPGVCQLVERGLAAIQSELAVRVAYDGRAALNAMQQERPDLVILDLIMPQMDGLAVLTTMQDDATLANVPVILLTATNFMEDRLAQVGSQIRVSQTTPWHPGDTLRYLEAILRSVRPVIRNP